MEKSNTPIDYLHSLDDYLMGLTAVLVAHFTGHQIKGAFFAHISREIPRGIGNQGVLCRFHGEFHVKSREISREIRASEKLVSSAIFKMATPSAGGNMNV